MRVDIYTTGRVRVAGQQTPPLYTLAKTGTQQGTLQGFAEGHFIASWYHTVLIVDNARVAIQVDQPFRLRRIRTQDVMSRQPR